jgi:hypothetical protein
LPKFGGIVFVVSWRPTTGGGADVAGGGAATCIAHDGTVDVPVPGLGGVWRSRCSGSSFVV